MSALLPRLANEIWRWASVERHRRYARALGDPARAQERVLLAILRSNAASEYGRRHGFGAIDSALAYQQRVPLVSYEELAMLLERIRAGEPQVLTSSRVHRLVPTSGSTAARKLVPYTRELQAEFGRAVGPWIFDLFRRRGLRRGRAYWSISPATLDDRSSRVPVGFADDSEVLGATTRALVEGVLAVPADVRHLTDVEAFRYATLLFLLRARDLALVSVWHPSFFTLLLRALPAWWDRLLDDVRRGTFQPPGEVAPALARALASRLSPQPRRADELRAVGCDAIVALWPRLELASCWCDAAARGASEELRELLPEVEMQAKGLIATEAIVTLPFRGLRPLALQSHFFEFIDDAGRARRAEELELGGEYSVVVTTGGGLYRYRLGDRVRVEGFLERTPSLAFVGREGGLVDSCGEKLSEGFVAAVLQRLLQPLHLDATFVMLAPSALADRAGYALFLQCHRDPPPWLGKRLEALLCENPHYAWCARLGQLAPARVVRVERDGHAAYLERCVALGRKLGDVKPALLSPLGGWERWFDGARRHDVRSERAAAVDSSHA